MTDLLTESQEDIEFDKEKIKIQEEIDSIRNSAWVNRYAPPKLKDVILPEATKNLIEEKFKNNTFQNMIFHSSSPGTGKTTVARIIPEEYGCDYMFVKTGSEARLDLIDDIASYGYQESSDGKPRFVILDEGDQVPGNNMKAFYTALQPLIESTSDTLRFIITCNHLHLIPEAIRSRCTPVSFSHNNDEYKKAMWKRIKEIANIETTKSGGIVNKDTLGQIMKLKYPDMRATINEMQFNFDSNKGSIVGVIESISLEHIKTIWTLMKGDSDILPVRQYYTQYVTDLNGIFLPLLNYIVDNDYEYIKPKIFSVGSIISEHQFHASFDMVEPEVNVFGMISKIMRILHEKTVK